MNKILLLLLLFTGIVNAQPPAITNPENPVLNDTYNDGSELFFVHTLNSEILGILNPNDYTVTYYHDIALTSIINEFEFLYYANNEWVYAKVTENADVNNFATTSFQIILVPTPVIGQPENIFHMDIPFDGIGNFDLTSQSATILNGLTGVTLNYYTTLEDAQTANNAITNASSYTNLEIRQTIFARVTDIATGSYTTTQFLIVLTSQEIITIPDVYFRQRLDAHDTNLDGQIQLSEALSLTQLDLSNPVIWNYPVSDLTGIENFTNVKQLFIGGNPLGDVDLTSLINLEELHMSSTNATSLNVSGLTQLRFINCDTGLLTSLDVSSCPNLKDLFCARHQLTTLNINGLTNLETLYCNNNQLTSLDVSALINLTGLCCSDNQLTSLNLDGLTNLQGICYGNQGMNPVDISGHNFDWIAYGGGITTELDLSHCTNLQSFRMWGSNVTSLDFSNSPLLNVLALYYNNDLTYANMKNGGQFTFSDDPYNSFSTKFVNNPNLLYVCTNEVDQAAVNNELVDNNNGSAHANTYCTFVPGGNYNTITGTIRFDSNSNGCDENDIIQPNIKVNINDGTTIGSTFIENTGAYHFYTLAGSFDLSAQIENPSWFNVSPATITVPFADNNNNISTQNFCLTANGTHSDLEIVVSPVGMARPGFDSGYVVTYRNKGNQVLSGNVLLTFDDDKIDLVFVEPVNNSQVTNTLIWNYSDLLPFETRTIGLMFNINSPMETPAVNGGDFLDFTASITPIAGDELPLDNEFIFHQGVVNSFDPNEITCIEGDTVSQERIGEYLHYLVQFENTGSASAVNIVVRDVIDTEKFDISTLQVISASADQRTVINGNVVEFIFENINLEQSSRRVPPVGGHGDVLFKIKTKDNLVTGDNVVNNANIYFDYNFPITTSDANTVFANLSNGGFELDASISTYPNPTNSRIFINADTDIKSIELYDIQGRILQTIIGNQKVLNITDKSNGIYFLKITTDKGSKVEKIVKE